MVKPHAGKINWRLFEKPGASAAVGAAEIALADYLLIPTVAQAVVATDQMTSGVFDGAGFRLDY
jgi:hypothetical protein